MKKLIVCIALSISIAMVINKLCAMGRGRAKTMAALRKRQADTKRRSKELNDLSTTATKH